ncbi:MAG TPA: plastocyanin/azurin family copper-binding protein [Candidatus Angelobacter sp.]|nr:plastocyanin/azurin family copper-binding protein [Candidatus Angelobacter sp.]
MRWPYPRFCESSSSKTIILTIILMGLASFPLPDLPASPVRAASPTESAAIVDFAFQPQHINITTGTEVIWTNHGNTQHTVTSSPQTNTTQAGTPLISSGPLNPRQNFSYFFYKHGVYPIQCAFHPATMNGLVNVTGSDVQPPAPPMTTPSIDYTPYALAAAVAATIVILSVALLLRRRTKKPGNTPPLSLL